jgi:hypothetical protein
MTHHHARVTHPARASESDVNKLDAVTAESTQNRDNHRVTHALQNSKTPKLNEPMRPPSGEWGIKG